jgi:antitoxin component of RelBE/YafQ-DinJ toxin-antitoxin module
VNTLKELEFKALAESMGMTPEEAIRLIKLLCPPEK